MSLSIDIYFTLGWLLFIKLMTVWNFQTILNFIDAMHNFWHFIKTVGLDIGTCTNNTIYHRKPQYNNTSSKVLLGCHCPNRAFTLHENPKQRSINNCSSKYDKSPWTSVEMEFQVVLKADVTIFILSDVLCFLPLVSPRQVLFFINFSELGFRAKLTSKDKFPDIIMHIVYFQWMKKMKIASWRRLKRNV